MDQNKTRVAQESLQKVREYKLSQNYGRAFAHYLVYLELTPQERPRHEESFVEVLLSWCIELQERARIEDLYKCYLQALHYYPSSVEILNYFGVHLLSLEQGYLAKRYLELAHNLNKEFLPAEKNLSSAKAKLIPQWHFRMLNNKRRNKAYFNAITAAVDAKFNRVLDIGTGCGLLSLFASKNVHTKNITAIEENAAMAEVAKEVFLCNKMNIDLVTKNSTEVTALPYKSNVLVTEIFDTALFGEHVLETLIHAHKYLLEKDCRIVPARAKVFITGIECEAIHRKHKFINYDLKNVCFEDVCVKVESNEPYDAEHITNYRHKMVTNTCNFVTVDFRDLNQLERIYNDKNSIPTIDLAVSESGTLHAFVIWFELDLGQETITTNPFKDNCNCWEQAVVFAKHPVARKKGETIKVHISCVEDKLDVAVLNERTDCDCFEVSKEVVSFLNDRKLLETIDAVSDNFNGENLIVLDLCPVPIFGLNLALRNAHVFTPTSEPWLVSKLCEINKINTDNITIISEDELLRYLVCRNVFDIIFFNPVFTIGTINEKFYSNSNSYVTSLKDRGVILPQKVNLCMQIVESDYLNYCTKVDDSNVGFEVSKYVNSYSIDEQWDLDSSFPAKQLSEKLEDFVVSLDSLEPTIRRYKIKMNNYGKAHGILYWYNIDFFNNLKYTTHQSDYYNKACFTLKDSTNVKEGDSANVCVKQHRGLIKITCDL